MADRPRVAFVRIASWMGMEKAHPEHCAAPLDLGYAMALLEREGFDVLWLDTETGKHSLDSVHRRISSFMPDLVVLNGITPSVKTMLDVFERVEKDVPGAVRVATGQHASVLPATLLSDGNRPGAHVAVIGEPEITLLELGKAVAGRESLQVPGTASLENQRVVYHGKRKLIQDLDSLPYPSHERFFSKSYRYFHPVRSNRRLKYGFVMASRGCPHSCTFCSPTLRKTWGKRVRTRDVRAVTEELLYLEKSGRTAVVISDDLFNHDLDYVCELAEAIAGKGIQMPLLAECRVHPLDERTVRLLGRAGFSTLGFGVESGSDRVLERIRKGTTVRQAKRAFELCRKAGLLTVAFLQVGLPGETRQDLEATKRLLFDLEPDMLQVAMFTPYPGSAEYKALTEAQRRALDWKDFSHYNRAYDRLCKFPGEEMAAFQRHLYKDYLFRPGFVWRYVKTRRLGLLNNIDSELDLLFKAGSFLFR